ncbi:MAG: hypothetical protein DWH82_10470 [Planctomycetota bacterium]|nr:MAG: hypothetical protein DWH82_10470 [Planctomycetota bacterium]
MQSFPIEPGGIKWLLITCFGALVIMGVVFGLLALSMTGARSSQFEVSAEGLRLRGDLYGRLISPVDLVLSGVRRVDFAVDPGLKPSWRTMGTGLPGYQSGWFRLKDGDKALVYLTDHDKAVLIPTTLGFCVLVSPQDPDGLVRALQSLFQAS